MGLTEGYVLRGRQAIPCVDMLQWARELEDLTQAGRKHVSNTILHHHGKKFWISTVFLGLNHAWDEGPPLVFETMVFPFAGEEKFTRDLYMDRYSTWEEAVAGHEKAYWMVRNNEIDYDVKEVIQQKRESNEFWEKFKKGELKFDDRDVPDVSGEVLRFPQEDVGQDN